MSVWEDGDQGPDCFCGNPTVVKTVNLKSPQLLCLFHTREEGAMFPLPDTKPEWWPNPPSRDVLADYMKTAPPWEDEDDE